MDYERAGVCQNKSRIKKDIEKYLKLRRHMTKLNFFPDLKKLFFYLYTILILMKLVIQKELGVFIVSS